MQEEVTKLQKNSNDLIGVGVVEKKKFFEYNETVATNRI